jgi:hypothetical protein
VLFTPHEAVNPLPTGKVYAPVPMGGHSVPGEVASAQVCGCPHHQPVSAPAAAAQRPQVHITTGGLLVVVIGGVFLVITIGVILTSLLLAVAIVAGALAMTAMALAIVARVIQSMARDQEFLTKAKGRK